MPNLSLDLPATTTIEITVEGKPVFTEDAIILDTLLGESQQGYHILNQMSVWQAKFKDLLNARYQCNLTLGQALVVMRATLEITQSLKKSLKNLQISLAVTESPPPHFPQKNNGHSKPTSPESKHKEKLKAAKRRVG